MKAVGNYARWQCAKAMKPAAFLFEELAGVTLDGQL